jgi:hypothetical protein
MFGAYPRAISLERVELGIDHKCFQQGESPSAMLREVAG